MFTGFAMTPYVETMPFSLNWKQNYGYDLTIIFYAVAKFFQTSASLVLLVWLYELLPPIAECSTALHTCFTLANLELLYLPILLYYAVSLTFI